MKTAQEKYLEMYRLHGPNAEGLYMSSVWSQKLRFDLALALIPERMFSFGDLGCGTGDLYFHALQQGRSVTEYEGVDTNEEALAHAASVCYEHEICTFGTKAEKSMDYWIGIGVFNLLDEGADIEKWASSMGTLTQLLINKSRIGAVVSFMDKDRCDRFNPELFYVSRKWVRDMFGEDYDLTFIDNHRLYEFTVLIKHK